MPFLSILVKTSRTKLVTATSYHFSSDSCKTNLPFVVFGSEINRTKRATANEEPPKITAQHFMSILDKGTLNPIKVDIFKGLHYSRTSDSYRRLPTKN